MHRQAARLLNRLGQPERPGAPTGGDRATAEAATAGLLQAKVHLARGDAAGACDLARRLRRAFAADSLWAELARLVEWSAHHGTAPQQRPAPAFHRLGVPGQAPPARPRRPTGRATASPADRTETPGGAARTDRATAAAIAHCVPSAPVGPLSLALPSPHETAALRALAAGDHGESRKHL